MVWKIAEDKLVLALPKSDPPSGGMILNDHN